MCNLLIAVFHGKFAEAVDLGEKEKLEIPGGWGCSKTLRNGNSRGLGGSKVKNLPWGGGVFSGTAHSDSLFFKLNHANILFGVSPRGEDSIQKSESWYGFYK